MKLDPVLAEIRAVREGYAEKFRGNIAAMLEDFHCQLLGPDLLNSQAYDVNQAIRGFTQHTSLLPGSPPSSGN
jgi:hypothetical protein